MSYSAQGWAQRQAFGSPARKSVMQALCYLMPDETLTVYAAIGKTKRRAGLEDLTEFEERAIGKALRELEEIGHLEDTGARVNNMVVWRMPKYEAWLARAHAESPPEKGGASLESAPPASQTDDSQGENQQASGEENKPPQKRGGLEQAPPFSPSSPPALGQSPPENGGESSLNLLSTKPARARNLEDWRRKARVHQQRAPDKPVKGQPGTALKGHWRFWIDLVGLYGNLWLVQWGEAPTPDFIRVLNLWHDSGKWAEIGELVGTLTLERPESPAACSAAYVDELLRKTRAATKGPAFNEGASRAYWWNVVVSTFERAASAHEVWSFGTRIADLKGQTHAAVIAQCRDFTTWALEEERKAPKNRSGIEAQLVSDIDAAIVKMKAPPPSQVAAIVAGEA